MIDMVDGKALRPACSAVSGVVLVDRAVSATSHGTTTYCNSYLATTLELNSNRFSSVESIDDDEAPLPFTISAFREA